MIPAEKIHKIEIPTKTDTKAAIEVDTKAAIEVDTMAEMEVDTKTEMEVDTKAEIEVDTIADGIRGGIYSCNQQANRDAFIITVYGKESLLYKGV